MMRESFHSDVAVGAFWAGVGGTLSNAIDLNVYQEAFIHSPER